MFDLFFSALSEPFFAAVCLITNFIYQEPSLLTSLQEKGVTDAIMKAIFHQEVVLAFSKLFLKGDSIL